MSITVTPLLTRSPPESGVWVRIHILTGPEQHCGCKGWRSKQRLPSGWVRNYPWPCSSSQTVNVYQRVFESVKSLGGLTLIIQNISEDTDESKSLSQGTVALLMVWKVILFWTWAFFVDPFRPSCLHKWTWTCTGKGLHWLRGVSYPTFQCDGFLWPTTYNLWVSIAIRARTAARSQFSRLQLLMPFGYSPVGAEAQPGKRLIVELSMEQGQGQVKRHEKRCLFFLWLIGGWLP